MNDHGCLEFEPDPDLPPVYAILGRAVAPELTPENCWEQWATLPIVDCSDAALAAYRDWTLLRMAEASRLYREYAAFLRICEEAGI